MTALSNAVAGQFKALQGVAGVSITYTVPGTGSVTLTAVPGQSDQQVEQDGQVISIFRTRDYLILSADLVVGGSQVKPDRHHTITESGETHRVLHEGGNAAWRYTDHTKTVLRVSCKERS